MVSVTVAPPPIVTAPGRTRQITRSSATPQSNAVYSKGATTAAGAWRNASVMKCWPSAPVTPTPTKSGQWSSWSGAQWGMESSPAPTLRSTENQNTMLSVVSVRESSRKVTTDSE